VCLTAPSGLLASARQRLPLVVLAPPFAIPSVMTYLYWHERVDADPAHRWFRELVLELGVPPETTRVNKSRLTLRHARSRRSGRHSWHSAAGANSRDNRIGAHLGASRF
jgi:hypothetical protein